MSIVYLSSLLLEWPHNRSSYVHCYLWSVPTELPESLSTMSMRSYCLPALIPTKFPITLRITFQPVAMSSKTRCDPAPDHLSNLFFPFLSHPTLTVFSLPSVQPLKPVPVSGHLHLLPPHQKYSPCTAGHMSPLQRGLPYQPPALKWSHSCHSLSYCLLYFSDLVE